jgi:hypothetical protein
MAFARPERVGETGEPRGWRIGSRPRRTGRPIRIGSLDARTAIDADPDPAASTPDRVVLLRYEWRTSGDEIQPVLLALPELVD